MNPQQNIASSPEEIAEQSAYWRRQLSGGVSLAPLPYDRNDSGGKPTAADAAVEQFVFSPSLAASLKSVSPDGGIYAACLSGFVALLHRYGGHDEMLVGGSGIASTRIDFDASLGNIDGPLPLRIDTSGSPTFLELQTRVSAVVADAVQHKSSFHVALEEMRKSNEAREPLFNVVVAELPSLRANTKSLDLQSLELFDDKPGVELTLSIQRIGDQIAGAIGYSTSRFDRSTILEMIEHWQNLLQAVCADPSKRINEVSLLTEAERKRIVVDWNNTAAEFPQVCVQELFELQVAKTPDFVAVTFQGTQLSYRELNARANQLARHLRKRGIGPDVLAGVCLSRTPEMLVSLLGIWKAGGAYVPIDPTYPKDRISYMMEDSGAKLLVTDSRHQSLFDGASDKTVLIDAHWSEVAKESGANFSSGAMPSNLAYVMYTSGSTGKPKGAMILHSGLVNYLWWAIRTYAVQSGGSVPVHSSISFDLTVTSMYPALLAGGQVELLAEDVGAQNLLETLRQGKKHNLVKITPAHLKLLSQEIKPEQAASTAQAFVIGGENLFAETLGLWREFASATRLINEYGPTETVVGCCVHEVTPNDPASGSVPIGRPIANTQLYILDPGGNPVPSGMIGELYIGGAGVARGYLNRPELTEQKFIPDPFSGRSGSRLYRTGDLARYRKDGMLEFLGRIDSQVKVRGYRIELEEIEATLADHPEVRACAVLAREDEPGDEQLVGYVVAREGKPPTPEDLRQFLRLRLPDYMAPSQYVFLDSFPLTHNGKVDRKVLPPPSKRRGTSGDFANSNGHATAGVSQAPSSAVDAPTREFVRPQTETERAIAAIVSEVLKIDQVGLNDDFFNLGGHSLLAIKIVSRIRVVFDVDLPTQTLFESPTIAGLVKAVSDAQASHTAISRIEKHVVAGPQPLSFAQEQFWFLDQLASDSPVYNVVDYVVFEAPYNAAAMNKAFNELMRRHEVLRTAFTQVDGQPAQIVWAPMEIELREIDLSSLEPRERQKKWDAIAHDEGRKPFDLMKAPLLRATAIHFGPLEHRLLLTIHHIAVDEWSMEIIHDELRLLYATFLQGRASNLPELPIQYTDFAAWQRELMQGEVLQKQIAYWKEQVEGVPPALELPTDKARPTVPSFRGATEFFEIPEDLTEKLQSLRREQQATLFMILEASFMALLHRLTGQDDFLVGTPISGRTQRETESLIGCFLNTVVLRARFTEQTNFRALLGQVRERALGAYAHPDLPYEYLVSHLVPDRSMSRTPLVQVMFIVHNAAGQSQVSQVSGNHKLETGTSKFDLSLTFSETGNGLQGLFEYSTDLFDARTMQRIVGYYRTLLEAITDNPDRSISSLIMLPASERQQLLTDWNNTAVQQPESGQCLQTLFERQAALTPNQKAAIFGTGSLTYAELDRRSNQLARHLQLRGVGPDVLVGLSVERSLDMMVGLLGIMKSGGAYIPLDPAFPQDRLAYMVEDSKMAVLVTHHGLEEKLLAKPAEVIRLDSDWAEISKHSADPLVLANTGPKNLAYVLYTSGSTGKPKGVEIQQAALVNFLVSMRKEPGFTAGDTMLAVTTLSFDIAGLELYLPLICGGKIVIASYDETHDPVKLQQRMAQSDYTVMQATPATWRALIHAGWKGSSKLKILCGGEAFPPDLAKELLARCGQLWNMYGPTETTIWSTLEKVISGNTSVPIGHPINNTQVYVLDARRGLVPAGAIGELYIGGDGLARGYLNRPDLTKERFVQSPFESNALLYRTGDMARWLPNGTLECLGRVDNQVKIRGFRIELGEIEAALNNYLGIRQSAVVAREDGSGEKGLVAYYEPRKGSEPPVVAEIRAHLKKSLPDYMVPTRYMAMEKLPLTPNRKIDRKALPAPEIQSAGEAGEVVAPQDELERMLADVWSRLLKVKGIGSQSDFFELGGHSLAAVQMLAEVRNVTGKTLPLATLFEASTIGALAAILRREGWAPSWSSLVPIRAQGTKRPLFLVHGAEGNVLLYRPVCEHMDTDRPIYGLQSQGLNGDGEFLKTFQEMATEYLKEIRKVQPTGPYTLGGYCLGGIIAYEMAQQLAAVGETVDHVIMLDSYNMSLLSERTLLAQKPVHFTQNLWFHAANFLSLGSKDRNKFLSEKIDIARTRMKVRFEAAIHKLRGIGGPTEKQTYPHLMVKKVNDHAAYEYDPQPYAGHVDIIRPKSHFAWQSSPSLGWAEFVRGDLEVHELPIYPKGILVEPFCRQLAEAVTSCLEE